MQQGRIMTNTNSTDCTAGLAPRRAYVQANGTRLSYLEWGVQGRPLLLLHGITSAARAWWRVAPVLVAQGYHAYALDMPGHGESAETGDHRIENMAALSASVIRTLGMDGAVLIGHSWGGATALALAGGEDGALLRKVVLIDPALRMSAGWGAERLPTYLVGLGQPPEQTLPTVRANNPDWDECDVFWKGEALQQCRAAAVHGLFVGSGEWELTARFTQVQIPLLLLVADSQYTVIAPDVLAAAERALRPGLGRMVQLPGTTHNMIRGASYDATIATITAWLAEAGDN
jgi:pimeloyl-ACP methyl ester carboxylesterase